MQPERVAGPLVYAVIVVAGTTVIGILLHWRGVSTADARGVPFVLAAMWMPALARWIAVNTVDRGWRSPFPLRRWSASRWAAIAIPLVSVTTIYLGAYGLSSLFHVPRSAPVWTGRRLIPNIAVNLVLASTLGMTGALGEEIGWRGYLQPRLDQLNVPFSLLWTIAVESLFHLPLIIMGGYLGGADLRATFTLFVALGLGLTPVWTWATYRWGTLWMAVFFHTFHNAISQVLIPRALGDGSSLLLGEAGLFPVLCYLGAAVLVFLNIHRREGGWATFARSVVLRS